LVGIRHVALQARQLAGRSLARAAIVDDRDPEKVLET
jgi:hypothetical protein